MPTNYLFLSYAHADQRFVDELVQQLHEAGLQAWWFVDSQIAPEPYTEQLMAAIDGSQAMIVVLSRASVDSTSVLKEVLHASDRKKPIITVICEDCDGPLRFHLGLYHWVDARNGRNPMPKLLAALIGNAARPIVPTAEITVLDAYAHWVRPSALALEVVPFMLMRAATDRTYTLCTIGRRLDQQLLVAAEKSRVSKQQAVIRVQVSTSGTCTFVLADGAEQPSRNGTFVNGQRLAVGVAHPLAPYDLIGLAGEDVVLRFVCVNTTRD